MHTPHTQRRSLDPATAAAPAPQAATEVPLEGIEKLMADALIALDRKRARAMPMAGETEYASWLRLLRRPAP